MSDPMLERSPERAGDLSSPSPAPKRRSATEILEIFINHHNKNPQSHHKVLDLSNTSLDFEFSSLFSIIKLPAQIKEVSFENCSISEKCVNHIMTGLTRNSHLPELKTTDMTLFSMSGKPTNKRDIGTILSQFTLQNFHRYLKRKEASNQIESEARSREVFRYLIELSSQMIRNHQSYGMQVAFEEENERDQIKNALSYLWKIERQRRGKRIADQKLIQEIEKLFGRVRMSRNKIIMQYCVEKKVLVQRYEELQREIIIAANTSTIRQIYSLRSASFDTHTNLYQLRVRRYATKRAGFFRSEAQKRQKVSEEETDSFANLRGEHFKKMTEMLTDAARDEATLADAQKLERTTKYEAFRKRILDLEMARLDRASLRQQASTNRLAIFESEMKERGDITDAESKIYDLLKDIQTTMRDAFYDRVRIDKMIREASVTHCFIPRVVLVTKKNTMNPVVSYRETGSWTEADSSLSLKLEPMGSWYTEAEQARDQIRVAFSSARKVRQQRVRSLKVSWQLIFNVYVNQMKLEMSFLPSAMSSSAGTISHQHYHHSSSNSKLSRAGSSPGLASATSSSGYTFTPELPIELRKFATPQTLDDCPDEQERCPPVLTKTIEQVVVDRCQCENYNIEVQILIQPYVGSSVGISKFQQQDLEESFALCLDVDRVGKIYADKINAEMLEEIAEQEERAAQCGKKSNNKNIKKNNTDANAMSQSFSKKFNKGTTALDSSNNNSFTISPHDALVQHYSDEILPSERPISLSTSFKKPATLEKVNQELRKFKFLALYRHDITRMTPVHFDPQTCTIQDIVTELKMSDFVTDNFLKLVGSSSSVFDATSSNNNNNKTDEILEKLPDESDASFKKRKQKQKEEKQKEEEEKQRKITISHERALDIFRAEQPASFYSLDWKFTLTYADGCSDEERLEKLKIETAKQFDEWQKDQARIAEERRIQIEEYEAQLEEQRILREEAAAEKARKKQERLAAKQKQKEEKERERELKKQEEMTGIPLAVLVAEQEKQKQQQQQEKEEQGKDNNDDDNQNHDESKNNKNRQEEDNNNNNTKEDDEETDEEKEAPQQSSENNNNTNTTNSKQKSFSITVNSVIKLPPLPPSKVQPPPPHVEYDIKNKSYLRNSVFGMPVVLLQPSWYPKAYFRTIRQVGEGGAKAMKIAKMGWSVNPVWQVLHGDENMERENRAAMLFGKNSSSREPPPSAPQVINSLNCVVNGNFKDRAYKNFSGFTLEVHIRNIEHGDRITLETGNRFWISAHGSLLRAGTTDNGLAEVDFGSFSSLNERRTHRMIFTDKFTISEHDIKAILNMISFKNVNKRPSESIRIIEVVLSPPDLRGPSHRFEIDLRAPDTLPSIISPTKVVSCRVPQKQTFGNFFNVPYFDLEMVPKLLFAPTKKGKRAQLNSPWFNPVSLEELVDMTQSAASNPVTFLFPDTTVTCPDTCSFAGGKITFNFRTGMIADHLWLGLPTHQPSLDAPGAVFLKLIDEERKEQQQQAAMRSSSSRSHSRSQSLSVMRSSRRGSRVGFETNTNIFEASANNNNNNTTIVSEKETCFSDENVLSGNLFQFATAYLVLENRQVKPIAKVSCAFFAEEELGLKKKSSSGLSDSGNSDEQHDDANNKDEKEKQQNENNNKTDDDSSTNIREKIGVKEIVVDFFKLFYQQQQEDDENDAAEETKLQKHRSSRRSTMTVGFNNNSNNTNSENPSSSIRRNSSIISRRSSQSQNMEYDDDEEEKDLITVAVVEKIVHAARFTTLTPYHTQFGGRDVNLHIKWNNSNKVTPSQIQRRKKRSNILEATVRVNILNSLLRPAVAPTQTATGVTSAATVVAAAMKSKKEAAASMSNAKVPETLVEVSKGMSLIKPLELPEQPEDNAIIETKQFPVGSFLRFDLTGNFEIGDTLRIDKPDPPKDILEAINQAGGGANKKESKLQSTLPQDNALLPPPPNLPDLSRWNIEDLPHDAGLVNMWLQEVPKSVWETSLRHNDLYSRRSNDRSALPFADIPPCDSAECILDYHSTRQLCVSKNGTIEVEPFWFSEWKKRCQRRHAPPSMMGDGTKADWPWPPFSAFEEVYSCSDADQLLRGFGSGVFNDQTYASFPAAAGENNNNNNKKSNNNNNNNNQTAPIMKLKGGLSAARANIPRAMVPKQSGVDFFKGGAFSRWFFETPEDVYVYAIKRGHAIIAKIYVCPRSILFVTHSPKIQKQDLFAMSLMVSIGCTKPLPDSMRKLGRWTLFDGSSYSTQVVPIRVNPVPRPIGMQIKNAPRSRLYRFGSLPIARLMEELNATSNVNNSNNNNNNAIYLDRIKQIGNVAMPHHRPLSERDIALGDGPFRPFGINELTVNAPDPDFFTWKHGCFFVVESTVPSQEDAFGLLSIEAQVEFFKEYLRSKKLDDEEDLPVPLLAVIPFDNNNMVAADVTTATTSNSNIADNSNPYSWTNCVHQDAISANLHTNGLSGSIGRTPQSVLYRLFENPPTNNNNNNSNINQPPTKQSTNAANNAAAHQQHQQQIAPIKLRLLDVSSYQKSCSEAVTVYVEKKVPISATTQDFVNETDYRYMDLDVSQNVMNQQQQQMQSTIIQVNNNNNEKNSKNKNNNDNDNTTSMGLSIFQQEQYRLFDTEPDNYYEDFADYYNTLNEVDDFGYPIKRRFQSGSTPAQSTAQPEISGIDNNNNNNNNNEAKSPPRRGLSDVSLVDLTRQISLLKRSFSKPSKNSDNNNKLATSNNGKDDIFDDNNNGDGLKKVLSLADLRSPTTLQQHPDLSSSDVLELTINSVNSNTLDKHNSGGALLPKALLLAKENTEIMVPDDTNESSSSQQQQQSDPTFLDVVLSCSSSNDGHDDEHHQEEVTNNNKEEVVVVAVPSIDENDSSDPILVTEKHIENKLPLAGLLLLMTVCEEKKLEREETATRDTHQEDNNNHHEIEDFQFFKSSINEIRTQQQQNINDMVPFGFHSAMELTDSSLSSSSSSNSLNEARGDFVRVMFEHLEFTRRNRIQLEYIDNFLKLRNRKFTEFQAHITNTINNSNNNEDFSLLQSLISDTQQQEAQIMSKETGANNTSSPPPSSLKEARALFIQSTFDHLEFTRRGRIELESLQHFMGKTRAFLQQEKTINEQNDDDEEDDELPFFVSSINDIRNQQKRRINDLATNFQSALQVSDELTTPTSIREARRAFVQLNFEHLEFSSRHSILLDQIRKFCSNFSESNVEDNSRNQHQRSIIANTEHSEDLSLLQSLISDIRKHEDQIMGDEPRRSLATTSPSSLQDARALFLQSTFEHLEFTRRQKIQLEYIETFLRLTGSEDTDEDLSLLLSLITDIRKQEEAQMMGKEHRANSTSTPSSLQEARALFIQSTFDHLEFTHRQKIQLDHMETLLRLTTSGNNINKDSEDFSLLQSLITDIRQQENRMMGKEHRANLATSSPSSLQEARTRFIQFTFEHLEFTRRRRIELDSLQDFLENFRHPNSVQQDDDDEEDDELPFFVASINDIRNQQKRNFNEVATNFQSALQVSDELTTPTSIREARRAFVQLNFEHLEFSSRHSILLDQIKKFCANFSDSNDDDISDEQEDLAFFTSSLQEIKLQQQEMNHGNKVQMMELFIEKKDDDLLVFDPTIEIINLNNRKSNLQNSQTARDAFVRANLENLEFNHRHSTQSEFIQGFLQITSQQFSSSLIEKYDDDDRDDFFFYIFSIMQLELSAVELSKRSEILLLEAQNRTNVRSFITGNSTATEYRCDSSNSSKITPLFTSIRRCPSLLHARQEFIRAQFMYRETEQRLHLEEDYLLLFSETLRTSSSKLLLLPPSQPVSRSSCQHHQNKRSSVDEEKEYEIKFFECGIMKFDLMIAEQNHRHQLYAEASIGKFVNTENMMMMMEFTIDNNNPTSPSRLEQLSSSVTSLRQFFILYQFQYQEILRRLSLQRIFVDELTSLLHHQYHRKQHLVQHHDHESSKRGENETDNVFFRGSIRQNSLAARELTSRTNIVTDSLNRFISENEDDEWKHPPSSSSAPFVNTTTSESLQSQFVQSQFKLLESQKRSELVLQNWLSVERQCPPLVVQQQTSESDEKSRITTSSSSSHKSRPALEFLFAAAQRQQEEQKEEISKDQEQENNNKTTSVSDDQNNKEEIMMTPPVINVVDLGQILFGSSSLAILASSSREQNHQQPASTLELMMEMKQEEEKEGFSVKPTTTEEKFPFLSFVRSCNNMKTAAPQEEEKALIVHQQQSEIFNESRVPSSLHTIGTSDGDEILNDDDNNDNENDHHHQEVVSLGSGGSDSNNNDDDNTFPRDQQHTAADFGGHQKEQQKEEFKIIRVPEIRYEPRYSAVDILYQVRKEETEKLREEERLAAEAAQALLDEASNMKKSKLGKSSVGARKSSPNSNNNNKSGNAAAASSMMMNPAVGAASILGSAKILQQEMAAVDNGNKDNNASSSETNNNNNNKPTSPGVAAIDLLYDKIISDRIEKHSVEIGTVAPNKTKKNRIGPSFLINIQEPETFRNKTFRESKAYVPVNTCLLNLLASSFGWAPTKTEKWIPNEAVVGPRTFKVQLHDRYIPGTSNTTTKLRVAPPAFSLSFFDWSSSFIPRAPIPANVGVNAGKNIFALPNQLFGTAECYPVDGCCTMALFLADESKTRAHVSISPSLAAASMYSPWSMKKTPQTGVVFSANVAGRANASRARIVFENSAGVIVQIDGVLPTPQWLVEMSKIVVLNPEGIISNNNTNDDEGKNNNIINNTGVRFVNVDDDTQNNDDDSVIFWCLFSTGNVCNACKLVLQV